MKRVSFSLRAMAAKGQNTMELVLTLGFVLVISLTTIELGRIWMMYTAVRGAALDGVVTASKTHNAGAGLARIDQRLALSNLTPQNRAVQAIADNTGYQASVTVMFTPLFGGMSLPTPGGTLVVAPPDFPITYQSTRFYSVY